MSRVPRMSRIEGRESRAVGADWIARAARVRPRRRRVDARFATEPGCPTRRGRHCVVAHGTTQRSTRHEFGGYPPLLVSVRSSPPISMPGMLDTVLNVGLTESATRGLLRATGNPSFVWDTSRRFAQAFAETVWGAPAGLFARADERPLTAAGADSFGGVDPLTLRDAPVRRRSSLTRSADHLFPMIRTGRWRRQSRPCSGHGRPLARVTIAV